MKKFLQRVIQETIMFLLSIGVIGYAITICILDQICSKDFIEYFDQKIEKQVEKIAEIMESKNLWS